jgi:hypothetical protein
VSLAAFAELAPADRIIPQSYVDFCAFVGFDLTKGQYAFGRCAFDGRDPETELEREIFGGATYIPPASRKQKVLRFGRGSGKSTVLAARGLHRCMTADVSMCGPGDVAMVIVIAQTEDDAIDVLLKAKGMIGRSPTIARMVTHSIDTNVQFLRPDGAAVQFEVRVAKGQGKGTRGPSIIEAIIDESEFINPATPTAVISDRDIVTAILPRLLPDGCVNLASTPWPTPSLTARLFEENFGHPRTALAALGTSLVMRDHHPQVVAARDAMMSIEPARALQEFDCIITDIESAFFESSNIDRAVKAVRRRNTQASSGIDLGFVNDSAGHVMVERQGARVAVTHTDMVSPEPGKPLVPSEVCERFIGDAKDAGCTHAMADQHYFLTAVEHGQRVNLQVAPSPKGQQAILDQFVYARDLLREGLVDLPNDPELIAQLKSVRLLALPGGGMKPVLPHRRGSGHADLVPALMHALWQDRRFGPLLRGPEAAERLEYPEAIQGPFEQW